MNGVQDDPLSLNRFIYAEDNPVSYNDPAGHMIAHLVGGGGYTTVPTSPPTPAPAPAAPVSPPPSPQPQSGVSSVNGQLMIRSTAVPTTVTRVSGPTTTTPPMPSPPPLPLLQNHLPSTMRSKRSGLSTFGVLGPFTVHVDPATFDEFTGLLPGVGYYPLPIWQNNFIVARFSVKIIQSTPGLLVGGSVYPIWFLGLEVVIWNFTPFWGGTVEFSIRWYVQGPYFR